MNTDAPPESTSTSTPVTRRLVAVVIADVVGYSALMERDESGAHARLREIRDRIVDPRIAAHGGTLVKTAGDGMLITFASATEALRWSLEVQRQLHQRNVYVEPHERIEMRMGVNLGDVIVDGVDIAGDGVNVASRLEALAKPGGICVSAAIREQVRELMGVQFVDLGERHVKNIARPIRVYRAESNAEPSLTSSFSVPSPKTIWRWGGAGVAILVVAAVWYLRERPTQATTAFEPPALSVAILPLTPEQGDAQAARFAESFAADLTTTLTRTARSSRVVPAAPVATAIGAAADRMAAARATNVRYLLEGETRRSGDANTLNLRLVDAVTGVQVWTERSAWQDSELRAEPLTKLRRMADRVRIALMEAEMRRASKVPEAVASAAELALRASAIFAKDYSLGATIEADRLYAEALRRDPDLVRALINRFYVLDRRIDDDPHVDRPAFIAEMDRLTSRAIDLDRDNSAAWVARAGELMLLGRWDASLEASAKAIALDPMDTDPYIVRAWLMNMSGRPLEALALVDRALAVDPGALEDATRMACEAHLLAGQADDAVTMCERAAGLTHAWIIPAFLAAAYANQGNFAKATEAKDEVLRQQPEYSIAVLKSKRYSAHPTYLKLAEAYWYEGLRKAGLPEQ
jgi:Adenylate cyclase, family 3 (some proteins contain HAMP domain)